MSSIFNIKYREPGYVEPDHDWHNIHDFLKGFGWSRIKDGKEYFVWTRYLEDLTPAGFEELGDEDRIKVAVEQAEFETLLNKEAKGRLKNIADFKEIKFPMIKQKFKPLNVDDLVGIQPMTKPLSSDDART